MTPTKSQKILYVSTEVAPFAKTGGLADVAGSLPKALVGMGHDVRIVMPKYQMIEPEATLLDYPVDLSGRKETAIIRTTSIKTDGNRDVPVYLIDNYHFFDRPGIYGYWDEAARFAFFCKAVVELLPRLNWQPDVIHCNDWQTGPIPMLLKTKYRQEPFYQNIATVYTIHNLYYQGNFPQEIMGLFDLGNEYFTPDQLEFFGEFSYTKAGLRYADVINTVSKTYAEEIKFSEFGQGFQGLLQHRAKDLFGIVNGIDADLFNPETDTHIYKNYRAWQDKLENKKALQRELGLPEVDVPIFGLVHRLVEQKGLDLIIEGLEQFMEHEVQFVLLGTGEPRYEQAFLEAAARYPDKMYTRIGFDVGLAQKIYAASDYFLMPSWFEPCGLGQLISMRYGTIPIVRQVGGLADTVLDYNPANQGGTGFVFKEYTSEAFMDALRRAIELYSQQRERQQQLVEHLLTLDFSWRQSALAYLELYQQARQRR